MALQKNDNITTNIELADAYHCIQAFRFDYPGRVWVQVGVYDSEEAAGLGEGPLKTYEYTFDAEDFGGKANLNMAEVYTKIKEQEFYTDATDV